MEIVAAKVKRSKIIDFNVKDIHPEATADLFYCNDEYILVFIIEGQTLEKKWERKGYEPKFGVDTADLETAEVELEKLISRYKGA